MFAVRSSGGGGRLWVGQSLTSTALNDFGIWSSNGTSGDMSDGFNLQRFVSEGRECERTLNGISYLFGQLTCRVIMLF